jgi:hypothetical protein
MTKIKNMSAVPTVPPYPTARLQMMPQTMQQSAQTSLILGKAKDFDWTTDEVFGMGVTFAGLMAENFPEAEKDA